MKHTCFSRLVGKVLLCQLSITLCVAQVALADQTRSYDECIRLLESSQYDKSIALLQEMISKNPSKELWQCLGTVYFRKGDMRRAENAFKLGLTLDQDYWCLWGGLARVYYEQGRYDQSKEALAKANQLKETAPPELLASSSKSSPYKSLSPSLDDTMPQASGKSTTATPDLALQAMQVTASSAPLTPQSIKDLEPSPEPIIGRTARKTSKSRALRTEESIKTDPSSVSTLDPITAPTTSTPTPSTLPSSTPTQSAITSSALESSPTQDSTSTSALALPTAISQDSPDPCSTPTSTLTSASSPIPSLSLTLGHYQEAPAPAQSSSTASPEKAAAPALPAQTSSSTIAQEPPQSLAPFPTIAQAPAQNSIDERIPAPDTVPAQERSRDLFVPAHSNANTAHLLATGSLPGVQPDTPSIAPNAAPRRTDRLRKIASSRTSSAGSNSASGAGSGSGSNRKPKAQDSSKHNHPERAQKIAAAPDPHKFPGKGEYANWSRADKIYTRGSSCLKIGHYAYAAQRFEEAIAIYPYDPEFFHSLGLALKGQHKYEEAEKVCRNATVLSKVDWDTWCDLGSILFTLKRYSESREAFTTAARLGPNNQGKERIDWYLAEIGRRI